MSISGTGISGSCSMISSGSASSSRSRSSRSRSSRSRSSRSRSARSCSRSARSRSRRSRSAFSTSALASSTSSSSRAGLSILASCMRTPDEAASSGCGAPLGAPVEVSMGGASAMLSSSAVKVMVSTTTKSCQSMRDICSFSCRSASSWFCLFSSSCSSHAKRAVALSMISVALATAFFNFSTSSLFGMRHFVYESTKDVK
mmetsp:Transcript_30177/g.86950  ORF Transcript_30177/g.86950 Transcript_30177/m.86950 type:complete len:201 (-) Transcript_30177:624-1226(-)